MTYAAAFNSPTIDLQERSRSMIHLLLIIAMMWINIAPVASGASAALPELSFGRDRTAVAPNPARADTGVAPAPYLPGRAPAANAAHIAAQDMSLLQVAFPQLAPGWFAPASASQPVWPDLARPLSEPGAGGIDELVRDDATSAPTLAGGMVDTTPKLGSGLTPSWFASLSNFPLSAGDVAAPRNAPPCRRISARRIAHRPMSSSHTWNVHPIV